MVRTLGVPRRFAATPLTATVRGRTSRGGVALEGPDNSVDSAQVGCEWLSDHDPAMVHEPWRVGMVAVPDGGSAAVAVPGDDVELRVKLGPTQFTGREVARFAVYWGPVDLWMLGSPSGPADDDGPTEAPGLRHTP